jgi:E3 ubiquitin-protein ligase BRE1
MQEREKVLSKDRSDLRKLGEALLKSKKEVEKQLAARAKAIIPGSASQREAELQSEVDKCMVRLCMVYLHNHQLRQLQSVLKCSTCKMHMRNTVITKCMHCECGVFFVDFVLTRPLTAFCKQCVDSRISTRQRKCPYCSLPFAQSDVQQLYLQ